ncbi:MAG: RdgB/HAM1 family non-canonical purine NTP pyrophosphatase [Clostridia bacterium]|nr:RdgB/HAM1 family non-canonical purine NTP pyrophosphatase [Clostridia bacterium]
MRLIAATKNKGKVTELRAILGELGYDVVTFAEAGFTDQGDVEETADSFEGNARQKALGWQQRCGGAAVIADDSGLEVDALNGAPGIYSARYCEGTDRDRRLKLLGELEGVPMQQRTARFVSAVCCVMEDGSVIEARGTCEGAISTEEQGDHGFGYDCIFVERTTGKSFGLLSESEKDAVSHRGNALRALALKLKEYQQR